MKCILPFLFLFYFVSGLSATDLTGIYSYSKGMNKATGTMFVFQFKPDSAFFYLSVVSGSPDFMMTNLKGFLKFDTLGAIFRKDSCQLTFLFNKGIFTVTEKSSCNFDYPAAGQYKKVNGEMKKNNTWMTEYTEKIGAIQQDSTMVYLAPHSESKIVQVVMKDTPVKILDEFNGFCLIEIAKRKNEFTWVKKKNVLTNKK